MICMENDLSENSTLAEYDRENGIFKQKARVKTSCFFQFPLPKQSINNKIYHIFKKIACI